MKASNKHASNLRYGLSASAWGQLLYCSLLPLGSATRPVSRHLRPSNRCETPTKLFTKPRTRSPSNCPTVNRLTKTNSPISLCFFYPNSTYSSVRMTYLTLKPTHPLARSLTLHRLRRAGWSDGRSFQSQVATNYLLLHHMTLGACTYDRHHRDL